MYQVGTKKFVIRYTKFKIQAAVASIKMNNIWT